MVVGYFSPCSIALILVVVLDGFCSAWWVEHVVDSYFHEARVSTENIYIRQG